MAVTGCELVRFYRRECGEDSVELSLTMVHYSHGLSVSGTAKCFVCDPGLRNCPWVRIAEQGDLNEIYRRTFCDTTLYKPIEGNWYIELDHEN